MKDSPKTLNVVDLPPAHGWDGPTSTPSESLRAALVDLRDRPLAPPVYIVSPAQAENLRRIEAWLTRKGGTL